MFSLTFLIYGAVATALIPPRIVTFESLNISALSAKIMPADLKSKFLQRRSKIIYLNTQMLASPSKLHVPVMALSHAKLLILLANILDFSIFPVGELCCLLWLYFVYKTH